MFREELQRVFSVAAQYAGALPMSYSRVQTLLRCPLLFDLKYRRKIEAPATENDDMRIGKKAHMLMEHAMRNVKFTGDTSLVATGFSEIHAHVVSRSTGYQAQVLSDIREPMLAVLDRLLKLASLDGTQIFTERKICLDASANVLGPYRPYAKRKPNTGFMGFVDLELRRNGQMNLVDYKTELPTEVRRSEVIKQTGLYACMEFMLDPSLQKVSTYCIYLKDGTVDKTAVYDRATDLSELEQTVLNMFGDYIMALAEFVPIPKENRYCEYCEYKNTQYCTK